MYARVVSPSMKTEYSDSYTRKHGQRVRGTNYSLFKTTMADPYTPTPETLYKTDVVDTTQTIKYQRPPSAKMELVKLPDEYASTVKPQLDPITPTSTYRRCFGNIGEQRVVKRSGPTTIRQLSKQTQAEINGTSRITHYPPGYKGHIPLTWKGNKGKIPREDKNISDLTWQYHTQKTGYGGYVPSVDMAIDYSNVKRTMTTYRELCAAVQFDEK
jgi:hypothetical protein